MISGGAWEQFKQQVLAQLPGDARLQDLFLLPVCGTQFYRYDGTWRKLYSEEFKAAEKEKITAALNWAFDASGFRPAMSWGDAIEDRGGQITMSALGQHAPTREKLKWDPDFSKREKIMAVLRPLLPHLSIKTGGSTSIDITPGGIDKAHGIAKLHELVGIDIAEMLFKAA